MADIVKITLIADVPGEDNWSNLIPKKRAYKFHVSDKKEKINARTNSMVPTLISSRKYW